MKYSLSKIKQSIEVESMEEFNTLLADIPPYFFKKQFQKSKRDYLKNLFRLFDQIDHDFHFVYILKQEKYAFQLRWKEDVLKAHLDLLFPKIRIDLQTNNAV
tara:strand:- start:181 stop:486 length:306 start_codon:yes stop_codon:yes gene_type:complete